MQQSGSDDNVDNLFGQDKPDRKRLKKMHKSKEEEQQQLEDSENQDDRHDDQEDDDQDQDDDEQELHGKRKRHHFGKDKKKKKKKRHGVESFLEDEADQSDRSDQDDDEDLDDAELRNIDAKKQSQQYYKKSRRNQNIMQLLAGENEEQVNEIMQKRNYNQYTADTNSPSANDPKVYQVPVVKGKQDSLTLAILNKASKLKDSATPLAICSVMSMKRKFPGYIFVEANSDQDVKFSLEGFLDVMARQMQLVKDDQYQNLFKQRNTQSTTLKQKDYIRIRGGRYDGDLGKIVKLRKNGPEVLLQPRIDLSKFMNQIKAITDSDIADKSKAYVRAVKKHFSTRDVNDHKFRPDKGYILNEQLPNIDISIKTKLTHEGMIILPFSFADVTKQLGGLTYKQIETFKKDEGLAQFAKKQLKYLSSTISVVKGDQVEVIHGQLKGVYGIVKEVNNNIVIIQAKNNPRLGVFQQQISNLGKKYRLKQLVTVVSGNHQGRSGRILKIQKHEATILTQNNNQIKVNTNNIKVVDGTTKTVESTAQYKKNDLVLTFGLGDGVGMVLSSSKDSLTVVDLNNSIKVVNVIQVDKKLETKNNKAINTYRQQIKQGATIRISEGKYAGRKAEVRHVYKNNLFITSNDIGTPNGAYVIKDTNCTVITQSSKLPPRQLFGMNKKAQTTPQDEALAPGNTITIKSGEYKGYQGQIVNSYAGKVEIKLTAKLGKKVIVDAKDIIQQKSSLDMGKTPRVSGSSYVPQSPAQMGMGESRRDRGYYQ